MVRKVSRYLLILMVCTMLGSCSLFNGGLSNRKSEKAMAQQDTEMSASYRQAKQSHYDKQSERSQEMMKQTRKKNKKINRGKTEPWWKKVLGL